MVTRVWHCEAYGADDRLPKCFFVSVCTSSRQCSVRMHAERRRLFDRIQQLGRDQPEVYGWLAAEFRSPAELLGGEDTAPVSTDERPSGGAPEQPRPPD